MKMSLKQWQAGPAKNIKVVGWWTGYKIGGVISLYDSRIFSTPGRFENYWQISFLILD